MVSKLDELVTTVSDLKVKEVHMMVREKEAVIEAMQHQINPHFLYNSLDIIKSIAYLEEVPQIVQMTKGLADFYRYTAKTTQDRVTLLDEINYVKHYLSIIHVRFTSGFKSTFNIEPKYYNNCAVKLMLQPIVENAIKYAVESNDGKGCVEISALETNGDLVVTVSDNGPGMSQSRLRWVDSQIRAFDKEEALESIRSKSIGIVSVHARIALMYGDGYGISIDSSQNMGTQVKVKLPLKEG
jgi:two-component system sensor histidine kinase YesM